MNRNQQNEKNEMCKFLREYKRIWTEIEKTSLVARVKEEEPEKLDQIRHNILLYLRSHSLTHLFGLDNPHFRKALDATLHSRKTKKLFFLDILGAHAWANPLFHRYFYEQIPAYEKRNRTNIWNLVVQDNLIRNKIEERIAKWIDIDEVMPEYNSGDIIDLHLVRILSWSDEDMRSEVAQDLIDLHRTFNIPLFYIPPDDLQLLFSRKIEFHLALDADDVPIPNGCWIYEEQKQRARYSGGTLAKEPKEIIQGILKHRHCVFAAETRKELP